MSQASSLDEHEVDELVLSQTNQSDTAKNIESPRKTLKILNKSKKIQKPNKKRTPNEVLKSITAQAKLSGFQKNLPPKKPAKIRSPLKPTIFFCGVTFERLLPNAKTTKISGGTKILANFNAQNMFQSEKPCILCKQVAGIKTSTQAGEVHPICGLLCEQVIVDYEKMDFSLEKWDESMTEEECDICGRKGFLIRCLKK